MSLGEPLGAQHDLVEAVARYPAVQHPAAAEPFELCRPGIAVADLLPERVGITHGENYPIDPGRRHAAAAPEAVGIDRHRPPAGPCSPEARFRCVPQQIVVDQAKIVCHEAHQRSRTPFVAIMAAPKYLIPLSWMGGRAV